MEKDSIFNLKIDQRNTTITRLFGRHLKFNNNDAVERLFFLNNPQMQFIPIGYSKVFPNIKNFWIAKCPIKSIERSDFEKSENLEILGMRDTNIEAIDKDVFWGLVNLEQLHLYDGKITKIHEEAFAKLTKLNILNLLNNKLGYLPKRLFVNNVNLQEIHISNNKLKIIESQIFLGLTKITKIELRNNLCINNYYPSDVYSSLVLLNNAITDGCYNPLTDLINELQQAKFEGDSTISRLQHEKSENEKKMARQDNEISNLAKLNQNITTKMRTNNEAFMIEKARLEEELIVLSLNHTEAKIEVEKVVNRTFSLELILADLNQNLNESLKQNEEDSEEIKDLQESLQLMESNWTLLSENQSLLIDQLSMMETNLSLTLEEKLIIENNLKELQIYYFDIMNDKDQLQIQVDKMNETLNTKEANERNTQDSSRTYFPVFLGVFLVIFVLSSILIIIKWKKSRSYNTNEIEVAFHNE